MFRPDRVGMFRRLAALSIALFAIGCGQAAPEGEMGMDQQTTPPPMAPSDQLLLASAKVALPPAGLTAADLPDPESAGAQDLVVYCTACHSLPNPAMHSATDWPAVLRRMWLRMSLLPPEYTLAVPEMGEKIVLLDYLTSHALKVAEHLPPGPDREYFEQTCGRCHELPDPKQHSTEDWYVVVRRMNEHMQAILGTQLTSDQIERIVHYLSQT